MIFHWLYLCLCVCIPLISLILLFWSFILIFYFDLGFSIRSSSSHPIVHPIVTWISLNHNCNLLFDILYFVFPFHCSSSCSCLMFFIFFIIIFPIFLHQVFFILFWVNHLIVCYFWFWLFISNFLLISCKSFDHDKSELNSYWTILTQTKPNQTISIDPKNDSQKWNEFSFWKW